MYEGQKYGSMEEVMEAMKGGGHGNHTEPPAQGGGLSRAWFLKIKKAFEDNDTNHSGGLDFQELIGTLQELGIPVDNKRLSDLFTKYDPNHDGSFSFEEFLSYFQDEPDCDPAVHPEQATPDQHAGVDAGGKYVDSSFPPNDNSLFYSKSGQENRADVLNNVASHQVGWKRVTEICPGGKLFDNVHPNDIAQGVLGDCWLLAGLAALAEFPTAITNLFKQKTPSPDGKYEIRIYNAPLRKWEAVVIDDMIPVDAATGKPIFTQPQGNEMWVLLIEKAVAKWMGSYIQMSGAYCMLPYLLLTDVGQCKAFKQQPGDNYEIQVSSVQDAHDRNKIGLQIGGHAQIGQLWQALKQADEQNHMMGAWTFKKFDATGHGASGEVIGGEGIVAGHAYSLITAKDFHCDGNTFQLVQLRNPWGGNPNAEWKGALSDNWNGWSQFPELYQQLQMGNAEMDGMFWMIFRDFADRYTDIGIAEKNMQMPPLGEMEFVNAAAPRRRGMDGGNYRGKFHKKFRKPPSAGTRGGMQPPFNKAAFLQQFDIKPSSGGY
jgi:hypothetical protein